MNAERFSYNFMYYIEIEISSLCNRSCRYCPNSKIHRKRELMPISTFEKIMKELQRINFSGGIAFHQYNEPLLELDHLIECIKCAVRYLPNARLVLYTNGDYLDRDVYKKLKKLGIAKFCITCHLDHDETWNKESAYEKIGRVRKRIGYHTGKYSVSDDSVVYGPKNIRDCIFRMKEFSIANIKKYPVEVQIESHNFNKDGSTRMNTIDLLEHTLIEEKNNTYYCGTLLHGMHVSYKGNVYMCCDCCEDTKEAAHFLIGSVYEDDICQLFAKKYQFIDKYIRNQGMEVCKNCYWNK